jgi:hypothetical protein
VAKLGDGWLKLGGRVAKLIGGWVAKLGDGWLYLGGWVAKLSGGWVAKFKGMDG